MSLINQLPTYIYSAPKEKANHATPEYVGVLVGLRVSALVLMVGGGNPVTSLVCVCVVTSCLVCRGGFSAGEEIKSLPCFHSYHSECIDAWLCLNKVCPVCQFSIDHAQPSS